MRLNQFISQAGISSRRGADILISEKKVKLNGKIHTEFGTQVDPETDVVTVLQRVGTVYSWKNLKKQDKKITYALYKPHGYITSLVKKTSDPIVKNLIPLKPRVFPIGRLDRESEGLLLMTNDGALSQRLTHPSAHLAKTYDVTCITPPESTENEIKSKLGRLAKGTKIGGRKTLPCTIHLTNFDQTRHRAELNIILKEGRNRQIRRMLGKINFEVISLKRTHIGSLSLESLHLEPKKFAILKEEHLKALI